VNRPTPTISSYASEIGGPTLEIQAQCLINRAFVISGQFKAFLSFESSHSSTAAYRKAPDSCTPVKYLNTAPVNSTWYDRKHHID